MVLVGVAAGGAVTVIMVVAAVTEYVKAKKRTTMIIKRFGGYIVNDLEGIIICSRVHVQFKARLS